MKLKITDIFPAMLITMLILLVLEIIGTAVIPMVGIEQYRLPFNILIILYIGFKLDSPFQAILVAIIQYVHSLFSIEGVAMGTFTGVFICIIISYLKELLHFSSAVLTILVTQIFQMIWFLIVSVFIYIRLETYDYIFNKFMRFIPESIIISLLAPFFFSLMDRIWRVKDQNFMGDDA